MKLFGLRIHLGIYNTHEAKIQGITRGNTRQDSSTGSVARFVCKTVLKATDVKEFYESKCNFGQIRRHIKDVSRIRVIWTGKLDPCQMIKTKWPPETMRGAWPSAWCARKRLLVLSPHVWRQ